MDHKIKVSVVLPSLNVGNYIRQCIESIQMQSLEDLEIICVDAGSTDGTYEILEKFASEDRRIIVLQSEKKSYGYQVNMGMQQAKGRYVAIVDTDDMIKSDMYEVLYNIATENDLDFIKADFQEITTFEGNIEVKRKVSILSNDKLYNQVLNLECIQECFLPHITATWSGIYKRDFLEKHNILHNETPGASYQDTGFWFQTYMYAKRAYFINQTFYMYRVDNPNSSVRNSGKVYCICDEFDFIYGILKRNAQLEGFYKTIAWIFYKKYKRNIERVEEAFRGEFLTRFAKDFIELEREGLLSEERFSEVEWKELKDIQKKGAKFYEEILIKKAQFLKQLNELPNIIIYGAGKVGKEIFQSISNAENVLCFATTEKVEARKKVGNKEIKCIEDLGAYKRDAYVVIAVMHMEYQKKMIEKAQEMGFEKLITVPDGVFDY